MDWSSIGKTLLNAGLPLLGGAIGGPGGAAIGRMAASALGLAGDATPEEIAAAINTNPDNIVKLRELELNNQQFLVKAAYDAEVAHAVQAAKQVESVNKTLQTEAMGGGWLQRNHHAIESMTAMATVVAVYFVLPLLHRPVPTIPEFAFMMIGAILGVTAWQRGGANRSVAEKSGAK